MARINHNGMRWQREDRGFAQQWIKVFLQIQRVDENLAVNHLRGKTEVDGRAVPDGIATSDIQGHDPMG